MTWPGQPRIVAAPKPGIRIPGYRLTPSGLSRGVLFARFPLSRFAVLSVLTIASAAAADGGAVVEDLAAGSVLIDAGVAAGDRLVAWTPQGAAVRHDVAGPFDLLWLEVEEGPRGVELHGERGGRAVTFALRPGPWNVTARPASPDGCWAAFKAAAANEKAASWDAAAAAYREALAAARTPVQRIVIHDALGLLCERRRKWPDAEASYRAGLEIREGLRRESLGVAKSFDNLGRLARSQGRLAPAEDLFRRALALRERLAPGSLQVAGSAHNLGLVIMQRGDLALSEEYQRRALALFEALVPESLLVAQSLNNLGLIAQSRGDAAQLEELLLRSLAIRERLAPDSADVAAGLNNLGVAALDLGELDRAEDYYRRALEIRQRVDPDGAGTANSWLNLGVVASRRGDLARAEECFQRALTASAGASPGGVGVALSLHNLGNLARQRGDLDAAEGFYARALALREKLTPGTRGEVETLHALARLAHQRGRPETAAGFLERAVVAAEATVPRIGGSHRQRGHVREQLAGIYRDAVETLLGLGRADDAFHVLERSRARSLLETMAERDVAFTDVPASVEERRGTLYQRHDELVGRMAALDLERDAEELDRLADGVRELYREHDAIEVELRRTSPRFADLQYPEPLTLSQARDALDAGTLMLAYSVGEEATRLFAVTRDAVEVWPIAMREAELRLEVGDFRRAIARARDPASAAFPRLEAAGAELFDALIGPAAAAVERSERLLVVADGPLHLLPFAALVSETRDESGTTRYLADWRPSSHVLSMTLYAELRRPRPAAEREDAVALALFGDPLYPEALRQGDAEAIAEPRLRSARRRGLLASAALPHSREEVEGIAGLYPSAEVRVHLGAAATEESVKALAATRSVHFAVHGYLDERFPLSSGLVLTIPDGPPEGRENGLLQAWEVFESVRLDADLVVLSACASALGEERGGEGLIGLTRAFQYAGARAVAATLWNVDDRATARLMTLFYRRLRAGAAKDEALRAAQVELRSDPEVEASAPYYWAAFQIFGDGR